MKGFFRFLVLILLIGGWGVAATSLHVVRHNDGVSILTKSQLNWFGILDDTYVDVRGWQSDDLRHHRLVSQRILDTGNAKFFAHITEDEAELRLALTPPEPTPVVSDENNDDDDDQS